MNQKMQEISQVIVEYAQQKLIAEMLNAGMDPESPEAQQQLNPEALKKLPEIEDFYSKKYETLAERSFVFNLNGTCSSPIGASAKISNNTLELSGALASPDGALITKNNISGYYKEAEKLGKDLAIKIINQMK